MSYGVKGGVVGYLGVFMGKVCFSGIVWGGFHGNGWKQGYLGVLGNGGVGGEVCVAL